MATKIPANLFYSKRGLGIMIKNPDLNQIQEYFYGGL